MAITGRTATIAQNASAQSITGTLPTDRVTGDCVVAVFAMQAQAGTLTPPSGWTELAAPTVVVTDRMIAAYYRFDPPSAPVATTTTAAARQTCACQAYGGVNTGTPVDVAAQIASNASGFPSLTGITTVTDGAELVSACLPDNSTATVTQPSGFALLVQTSGGGGCALGMADKSQAVAGATGSVAWTSTATGLAHVAFVAALRPAAPTSPTKIADRGSVANATAATTSAVTLTSPTAIGVGNFLIARVAVDNSGTSGAAPGCTVTDPRSNVWTVLGPALSDPGAAAAGATAYLCYARVRTAYQAADALTFNWGGISTTAKAVVVEEWTSIDRAGPVAVAAVTNNSVAAASTTAVSVARTATAPNQLVYTCLATEGIAADSIGADADTTNGTWVTLTTTASANATATNNQRVAGQYKVVTAPGAQSWDSTITSRDWGAIAVVFNPPLPPPRAKVVQLAVSRSSNW